MRAKFELGVHRSQVSVAAIALAGCALLMASGCGSSTPAAISPASQVTEEQIAAVRAELVKPPVPSALTAPLERISQMPSMMAWGLKETAVDSLARIGPDAVEPLIRTMADPDADVRAGAARALGLMGPTAEAAVPALTHALDDPDEAVRQSAARALGQVGPGARSAVPALIQVLKRGEG